MENHYPERLIYKFLNEMYNLRKNRDNLSESEYNTGVKNIIKKMKNIRDNDILEEVKAKTAALTKRFENRVQIEHQKLEQLEAVSRPLRATRAELTARRKDDRADGGDQAV